MISNNLLSWLFGISVYFLTAINAREAIVYGVLARSTEFLYQVSVQIHGHGHVCGGGIIGDRFILTAAQCVLNRTRHLRSTHIYVVAGTKNLTETDPPAVIVRVEKVFFPKEFHPAVEYSIGDIAVLELVDSWRSEHEKRILRMKLPRIYESSDIGSVGKIAGFGWKEHNNGLRDSDVHLRFSLARIFPDSLCEMAYPDGAFQSDKQICAKLRLYSNIIPVACTGDIGSPLISDSTIVGILSKISHNCERGQPEVYTRVTHYQRIILRVLEQERDPDMISLHT